MAAVVAASMAGGSVPASAIQSDQSEAEGRFLTFQGGFVDIDDLAAINGAYSAFPSEGGGVDNTPLELEVLNTLDIDLGNGVKLFGDNGILALGALGQYANTAEDEAPFASSGLVGEDGVIAVPGDTPEENAYLDLTPLLEAASLEELLTEARLELGAISSSATTDAGEGPVGAYQIADGKLILGSSAVAGLSGALSEALAEISEPINDLVGDGGVIDQTLNPVLDTLTSTLNSLLLGIGSVDDLGVTATVDLDLQAALDSVLAQPLTSEDSAVTIDLSSGEIALDLARLVQDTQGGDYDGTLNNLPVNTELLGPDVIQAALDGVGEVLDNVPALLINAVSDALDATDLNIDIYGEINSLLGNIGTVSIILSGTLGQFIDDDGDAVEVDTSGTSVVGLPVGQLLQPILSTVTGTILPGLVSPIADAITDEGALDTIFRPIVEGVNTALTPVFGLVSDNLLALTANVQEVPGNFVDERGYDPDSFTQRALRITLLPNSPILQLSLASSTIRPADVDDDDDANANASASAAASANADDDSNAAAEAAAEAAAMADADTTASAAADADASAAAQAAADEDASSDASTDATSEANAAAAAAADAAASSEGDDDTNADSSAAADANAAAASEAAAIADASTDASASAAADSDVEGDTDDDGDASDEGDSDVDADANASASSASASSAAESDAAVDGVDVEGDASAEGDPDESGTSASSDSSVSGGSADSSGGGAGALPGTGASANSAVVLGAALLLLLGATALVVTRRKKLQS